MSLDTVESRLNKKEYHTLKDVVADIGQIFNNAKRCERFPSVSIPRYILTMLQTTRKSLFYLHTQRSYT